MGTTVTPFLWYHAKAREAVSFYVALIPDSRIDDGYGLPADTPSGPEGSVEVIGFTLAGRPFMAMGAAGADSFNHAISLSVGCDTQAEIDRLWEQLTAGGGKEIECGWLKDRYGLSWQIVPNRIGQWTAGPDREGAKRATQAMMQMVKLDIATLKAAYEGVEA
jgi:predicted 3-demethylubiquinone-9 3-methyltransferase (glyoxalase superfamily)